MSVMLRLARAGAKKKPFYRVVATDKRSAGTVASSKRSASTILDGARR